MKRSASQPSHIPKPDPTFVLLVFSLIVLSIVLGIWFSLRVKALSSDTSSDEISQQESSSIADQERTLPLNDRDDEQNLTANDIKFEQTLMFMTVDREVLMNGRVSDSGEVTFGNWYKKANEHLKYAEYIPGEYSLVYLDRSGNEINTISMGSHYFIPGKEFSHFIPGLDGTKEVQLRLGDKVLARKVVSDSMPEISLVSTPFVRDGSVVFEFTASDADGDPLEFSIFYSNDQWQTYNFLIESLNETTYLAPIEEFTPGVQYSFKVYVTDGYHTKYVKTDPIPVR